MKKTQKISKGAIKLELKAFRNQIEESRERIEILSGISAGKRNKKKEYPEGSINNLVETKLKDLAKKVKEYGGN